MDDILEGFEIAKPPDKRKLFSKLRRRVSITYDSHIDSFGHSQGLYSAYPRTISIILLILGLCFLD